MLDQPDPVLDLWQRLIRVLKCRLPWGLHDFKDLQKPMNNILDHVSQVPVLEIDVWSRSATCKDKSSSQLYRLLKDGYLREHVHVQQQTGCVWLT